MAVMLRPGEIYGLLGENGSGQSAILRRWASERPDAVLVESAVEAQASARLAVLREALEGRSELLVEEPTLGLDDRRARLVCQLLAAAATVRPVIIATCSPALVRELCHHVGFVHDGAVVVEGETASLLVPYGYVVEVRERLDDHWADAFDGFELVPGPRRTRFVKEPCDQASLHGALRRIRDLGLKLVSVTPTFQTPYYGKEQPV